MRAAIDNQQRIASIRRRMVSGELSYEQAKAEAQPIIDDINAAAQRLAKKHNVRAGKLSFAAIMR